MYSDRMVLLGGSFNPPHLAHLALSHAAVRAFDAPCQWLPCGQPWQKPHVVSAQHRLQMSRLALADDQAQWRDSSVYPLSLNNIEMERARPSYTIDTLNVLRQQYPHRQWIWVIGQDQWDNFATWHQWQAIMNVAHIAVAQRAGYNTPPSNTVSDEWRLYNAQHRCEVGNPVWQTRRAGCVIDFPAPLMALSSTAIRYKIQQGEDWAHQGLVTQSVWDYIQQQGLYR